MNYITTNHQGGLCNVLFKLSATISLAIDNKVDYIFSKEFIRWGYDPDYERYKTNILRNVDFIDVLPETYITYNEPNFSYNEINYTIGTNLLLSGYYQSEKYFKNNKDVILNLFEPTKEIINHIKEKIPKIENYISIHVRRGDYLNLPNFHPQQDMKYYTDAIDFFGRDNHFIIFSDDLDYVKMAFDFLPKKTFTNLGEDYLDLYAISLCQHHIISNSTFGWWGSYLNTKKDKKIISPLKWFGPNLSYHNTSDLIPEEWIRM
jgi:hypothetical protein